MNNLIKFARILIILSLGVVFIIPNLVNATILVPVIENLPNTEVLTTGGSNICANNRIIAQYFQLTEDATITSMDLIIGKQEDFTSSVVFSIAANNSTSYAPENIPGSNISVNTWTSSEINTNIPTTTTPTAFINIPLDTPAVLTANTKYWVVVETGYNSGGSGLGRFKHGTSSTNTQSSGLPILEHTACSGSTFADDYTKYTTKDMSFRLWSESSDDNGLKITTPSDGSTLTTTNGFPIVGDCITPSEIPSNYVNEGEILLIIQSVTTSQTKTITTSCDENNNFAIFSPDLWNDDFVITVSQLVHNAFGVEYWIKGTGIDLTIDWSSNPIEDPITVITNLAESSSDACNETSGFGKAICKAFVFLFYPDMSIDRFENVKEQMKEKAPFAYFYEVAESIDNINLTNDNMPVLTLNLNSTALNMGNIEFFSANTVENLAGETNVSLFRSLMVTTLWVITGLSIYKIVSSAFNKS